MMIVRAEEFIHCSGRNVEKLTAKYPCEPACLSAARLEDGTLRNW